MHNLSSTYGLRISSTASDLAKRMLWQKYASAAKTQFSKNEIRYIKAHIDAHELPDIVNGVNFSRIQIDEVVRQRRKGGLIEFEALGPYLVDYLDSNGIITLENLLPEDRIGLELTVKLRKLLPKARMVSLYDDVNGTHAKDTDMPPIQFTEEAKHNFRSSLLELFKVVGVLTEDSREGEDYLFIAESDKISSAERMVERLEKANYISRQGQEIWFVNELAENPLYRKFRLRSKSGYWLCVSLDAASFLAEENKRICHIVALPEYMKQQQDKVWEVLRVLGIHPLDYHNIFYPVGNDPRQVSKAVWRAFQ